MRRLLALIPLLFVTLLHAQQRVTDSLDLQLRNPALADSLRLNSLLALSHAYSATDPDKGLAAGNKALALALRLQDRRGRATALNYMGLNRSARGEDSLALLLYDRALVLRRQEGDSIGVGVLLHHMGISLYNRTQYMPALERQLQAAAHFAQAGARTKWAGATNSIGVIYLAIGDYPAALRYFLQALPVFEQAGMQTQSAQVLTNIGLVYYHQGDYTRSLSYHERARRILEGLGDLYSLQNTLGNLGNTYDNAGEPRRALQCYDSAMAINRRLGNSRGLASNFINIAIVSQGLHLYDSAQRYLDSGAVLSRALGNDYYLSIIHSYRSSLYAEAPAALLARSGISPAGRYGAAAAELQRALALARRNGDLATESEAMGTLSALYEKQGRTGDALQAYKAHVRLRDSLVNSDKRTAMARMEMQYAFDKKQAAAAAARDKEQALAAAEIGRQRTLKNAVGGGAALLLAAAALSFAFYKKRRDAEGRRQEAELRAQVSDTEMKALRAQMNPHFIFNSLNSIGDYIARHDTAAADYYLSRFAALMRMILEHSEHREIPLSEDLKALEAYIELEALRMNHRFSYEIRVDEAIDRESTLVPPLLLQPFVENSIWHGIAPKRGEGHILIEIRREAEMINCIVEDNGAGRAAAAKAPGERKGLGMKITRSRIDILNRLKRSRAGIELSDLAEGMRVELRLPLELLF